MPICGDPLDQETRLSRSNTYYSYCSFYVPRQTPRRTKNTSTRFHVEVIRQLIPVPTWNGPRAPSSQLPSSASCEPIHIVCSNAHLAPLVYAFSLHLCMHRAHADGLRILAKPHILSPRSHWMEGRAGIPVHYCVRVMIALFADVIS